MASTLQNLPKPRWLLGVFNSCVCVQFTNESWCHFGAEPSPSKRVQATGEGHPQDADWGWKDTSTELTQKSSKHAVSQSKHLLPSPSSREQERRGRSGGKFKREKCQRTHGTAPPWGPWDPKCCGPNLFLKRPSPEATV